MTELVPVVLVFTKYDKLLRTKKYELEQDHKKSLDSKVLDKQSSAAAQKAFEKCVRSLEETMKGWNTPMPSHVNVSSIVPFSFFDPY